jgi:transcriptional regulator with GAF, ATPase, and Fis domain
MTIEEFQKEHGIVGKSKEIRDLVDITMQVAPSDITVLVYGESGVGKEVFARAIHNHSRRAEQNMVSVNCGAIPEGILESELFGHKKGAFTGAVDDRKGYFEIADKGTLFLDEIAEMPLTTQVKLLRVLETKEFMRIGGEKYQTVDVRIIAATNKDLQKEVDAKRFRNDLYFRLKAVALYVPPLRKRREDIPILIEHFLREYARKHRISPPEISDDAINVLYEYNWPGNIRELKNVLESAVALSREGKLDATVFAPLIPQDEESFENKNLPVHLRRNPEHLDREMLYRALVEIKKDIMELKELAYDTTSQFGNNQGYDVNEVIPLDKLERNAIINALNYTKGNKRKAAQLLNVSERTLYRKIKEYEI